MSLSIRISALIFVFTPLLLPLKGQSVLSDGRWVKMAVSSRGVYELDYNLLAEAGFDPAAVDPRKIAIYGNGGKMLPQKNSDPRPSGLTENHILVTGEQDGRFDPGDKVFFFADGPDELRIQEATLQYEKNNYEDFAYYFLTVGEDNGARVQKQGDAGFEANVIDTYTSWYAFEEDNNTLLISGREWYGDVFSRNNLTISYPVNLNGLKNDGNHSITARVIGSSLDESQMNIRLDGINYGDINLPRITEGRYDFKGRPATETFHFKASNLTNVTFELNPTGSRRATAYLDYFIISYEKDLIMQGQSMYVVAPNSASSAFNTYQIGGFDPSYAVWDVTNPLQPRSQTLRISGDTAFFTVPSDGIVKPYLLFNPQADHLAPVLMEEVENQDAFAYQGADLLIISHPDFLAQAQRLSTYRAAEMTTEVVDIRHIYNDFGSGSRDVTAIRDFIKYWYDRSGGQYPSYVLFMGDASWDMRGRSDINQLFIPSYQSYNSLHPVFTYSSDDYFGFMEDDEGEWVEQFGGDHTLEVGIGRLPVKTAEEATAVINKIIAYENQKKEQGLWKTRLSFIADDGDNHLHLRDAEDLTSRVIDNTDTYLPNKFYLDAFPQVNAATSQVSPAFQQSLLRTIDDGTLILNFTGHGSESAWTEEDILNLSVIEELENDFLPLFVTATCQFGRHDGIITSGAERLLLMENRGAIALLTTSRPVASSSNLLINRAFYDNVFKKEDGAYRRLGDIMRDTKNESLAGAGNRNFILLGDPSMRLAYPGYEVVLDRVTTASDGDTIRASSEVLLEGHISSNDQYIEQFNGWVEITVYDKPVSKKTLGDESPPASYRDFDNILFRGRATVENGRFRLRFRMPKNISYNLGEGRIGMYAWDEELKKDAAGGSNSIVIGGETGELMTDNQPPDIELFLNDTTWIPGTPVNSSARLFAVLRDDNGINLSPGIGQEMVVIIDDTLVHEASEYYTASIDDYTKGFLDFPLEGLTPGYHTLTLRVWDNFNNSSSESIDFEISEDNEMLVFEVVQYPNPFRDQISIKVNHNRAFDELTTVIKIMNNAGREVASYRFSGKSTGNTMTFNMPISEDLNAGLYFFNVYIRSQSGFVENRFGGKIIKVK